MAGQRITEQSRAVNLIDPECDRDFYNIPQRVRLTSIMCTIGPTSRSVDTIVNMIEAGMSVARLSAAHTSYHQQVETIKLIRKATKKYSEKIGYEYALMIALDTRAPEIRTGLLEGGAGAQIELKKDDILRLSTNRDHMDKGTAETVYVDYDDIVNYLKVGNRIYLDLGQISLLVLDVQANTIVCKIENSGILTSKVIVSLPGIDIPTNIAPAKSKADTKFGIDQGVDVIIASYTNDAETINQLRLMLGEKGKHIKIIAKIENYPGIQNLDSIIYSADGVLISRGGLGVELPLEKVFLGQKAIIARCNKAGKPVTVASQFIETMMTMPRPRRSEVTDIANAVLDGVDCIALTKETARGQFPVECVVMAANICREAEAAIWHHNFFVNLVASLHNLDAANSIAVAAVEVSSNSNASAILVITTSGRSAFLVAKYRPRCPIIAITKNRETARQAHLYRGVVPLLYDGPSTMDWQKDVDIRVQYALKFAYKKKMVNSGDTVVVISGWKDGSGFTNTLRIIYAFNSVLNLDKMIADFRDEVKS